MSHWSGFAKGTLIILLGWAVPPRKIIREPEAQRLVAQRCKQLSLYELKRSPFCAKVRRCIRALDLPIERRNVRADKTFARQLVKEGGKFQIPCLRIDTQGGKTTWMYESDEINAYLEREFGRA